MERTRLTDKQRISRKKGRNTKKMFNGQLERLKDVIQERDKEIFRLREKIKLLEGQLLLYE